MDANSVSKTVTVSLEMSSCPICLQVPLGNVFQCKNGHIMCSGCLKQMKRCGECRTLLGNNVSRNRALEGILDKATFPCSHQNCKDSFKRKELERHQQLCRHRPVHICQDLGYNCEQIVVSADDFCKHLKDAHHVENHEFYFLFTRTWTDFFTGYVKSGRFQCWTDIFTSGGENYLLNSQLSFKRERGSKGKGLLSFAILFLGDLSQKVTNLPVFRLDISTIYKSEKAHATSCDAKPTHFKLLADYPGDLCPSVSFPVGGLKPSVEYQIDFNEVAEKFDLVVEISMPNSNEHPYTQSSAFKRAKTD